MMQIYTLIISSIIFYRKQNFLAPPAFQKKLEANLKLAIFVGFISAGL